MSTTGITGLGQIALTVTDLDASLTFYRDVLGLTVLFTVPAQDMAFLDAGGGVRLYLGPSEGSEHLARPILYWTVTDLDAALAVVTAAGVAVSSPPHMVHRTPTSELWMFFVADPDGNPVALMQDRPTTG